MALMILRRRNPQLRIKKGVLLDCLDIPEDGTVIVPPKVKEISASVFAECKELKKLILPDSVQKIGEYAFSRCSNLTEIIVQAGTTKGKSEPLLISDHAFEECTALVSVDLPVCTEEIGNYAFRECVNLKRAAPSQHRGEGIVLPEGLKTIGKEAFYECRAATSLTVPGSMGSYGKNAFWNCLGVKEITLQFDKAFRFRLYKNEGSECVQQAMDTLFYRNHHHKISSSITFLCLILQMIAYGIGNAEYMVSDSAEYILRFVIKRNFYNKAKDTLNIEALEALAAYDLISVLFGNEAFVEKTFADGEMKKLLMLAITDAESEALWDLGVVDAIMSCKVAEKEVSFAFLKSLLYFIMQKESDSFSSASSALSGNQHIQSMLASFFQQTPLLTIPSNQKDRAVEGLFRFLGTYPVLERLSAEESEELILFANKKGYHEIQLYLMEQKQASDSYEGASEILKRLTL